MFTKISQLVFCMAMLVLPATLYGAQKLSPPVVKDFHYIYPLSGDAGASLYRVPLPPIVYTNSQQPNFHDLRVFDSQGVAMPMYISKVADARADVEHTYPAFQMRIAEEKGQITLLGGQIPVPAPQTLPKADSPTDRREADAILFDFTVTQNGLTDLRLIPEKTALPDPIGVTEPEGAVSDNTDEKDAKGGAENAQAHPQITAQATARATGTGQAGYVVSARLYTSENMIKWYDEGLRSFGRIYAAGQMLDLLTLNANTRMRYMLVVPVAGAHFFAVEGVSGIEQNRISRMGTVPLSSKGWDDKAGGYLYTIPPSMPVRALSLYLPDTTWLLRAEILTRGAQGKRRAASPNFPWQTRTSGVFYSLELNGTKHTSESVAFSPEWMSDAQKPNLPMKPNLLVRPKGAAWSKAPTLDISFEDQELYFMTAGPGPYRVAIGSSVPMPMADGPDAAVLKSLEGQATGTLHLGDMQEQLFAADVQKGQSVFIWGALLLGALCMGGIALHMLRSQRASKE